LPVIHTFNNLGHSVVPIFDSFGLPDDTLRQNLHWYSPVFRSRMVLTVLGIIQLKLNSHLKVYMF